jgi:hypothetical protein
VLLAQALPTLSSLIEHQASSYGNQPSSYGANAFFGQVH